MNQYKDTIFTLTKYLNRLKEFSQKLNLYDLVPLINDTLTQVEKNSLSIAVFGEFNRGKTTFINALIGQKILPTNFLPNTAVISRIKHSPKPGAKIIFQNGSEQEIPIYQLGDYITKITKESQAKAAKIKEASVYYPVPFCKKNHLEIIDTPGLNDDTDMTSVSLTALRQCSVAIMVISALSPFSIVESNFLKEQLLSNGVRRIMFVVNAIDLFNNSKDADSLVKDIAQRIQECIQSWIKEQQNYQLIPGNIVKANIWSLSALQALQGKQNQDMPLLAKSLFINFEYDFLNILERERTIIVLEVAVCQVINAAREISNVLNLQKSKLQLQQSQLQKSSKFILSGITLIRNRKSEVLSGIDTSFNSVKQLQSNLVDRFKSLLQQTAESAIHSTTITSSEPGKSSQNVQTNLAKKVLEAVQNTNQNFAIEIETQIQQALDLINKQMKDFTELFFEVIQRISHEMIQLKLDEILSKKAISLGKLVKQICNPSNHQPTSNLSFSFPNNSETFIFKDNPNGAGVGWGTVLGFVLTGGNPVGGAVGAAIGAGLGNNMRANNFKENYQSKVIAEIEKQVAYMKINETVDKYVSETFVFIIQLYIEVIHEINLCLETLESSLSEHIAKQEALAWAEHQRIHQMQAALETITDDGQKIFEQLCQLSA